MAITKRNEVNRPLTYSEIDENFQTVEDLHDSCITARNDAELAAEQAVVNGKIYPDTVTGIADTSDGDYFAVIGTGDIYVKLYLNDLGAAVFQKDYYSKPVNVDSADVSYNPAGTGAASTTVEEKLGEIVSVKDFGATGTGLNDDLLSIQSAVDYALSIGGTLYFPQGKYNVSGSIVIDRTGDLGPPNTNQKRIDIKGAGKGNTIINITSDSSAAMRYIGDASGSSAAHIYSTISNIAFSGGSPTARTSDGLELRDCAYMSVNEVTFHNLSAGLVLNGTLSSGFSGLAFNESVRGVLSDSAGFSGPHANVYTNCEFRQCTTAAYDGFTGVSQAVFVGCQFEGCGTHGDSSKGGLLFRLNAAAGEVGPSFYGCYFEVNGGGFDVKISETGSGIASAGFYSCNFNRVGTSKFVTNNIVTENNVEINLTGCSFTGYGGYVPDAGRGYINLSTASKFREVGCSFQSSIEEPIRSQSLPYAGRVNGSLGAGVTGRLPNGWSVAQAATGVFTITHNLGTDNYSCVPIVDSGSARTAQRVVINPNTVQVVIVNTADAATDDDFTFILQML